MMRDIGDASSAWGFIRDFVASWRVPLAPDDGWPEATLAEAEDRLDLGLPLAMREAYGLFGRRKDLTSIQDELLDPPRLYVDDGVLVFRVENQAVWHWGISVAALDEPDPPVVVRSYMGNDTGRWEPWLERFSLACVEIVLSGSLFSSEELSDNRPLEDDESGVLSRRYARLPLPEYGTPSTLWFTAPDLIMRDDHRVWLWVRARTPDALAEVRRELPGDWLMGT
ncbi:hypothetical protein [Actinomadura sp. 3N407]|uniref:hypothetical protein n=1 Tax=Actinomadura sp. 3N407 TaxID=3457423 RepID=UPI003FCC61DE